MRTKYVVIDGESELRTPPFVCTIDYCILYPYTFSNAHRQQAHAPSRWFLKSATPCPSPTNEKKSVGYFLPSFSLLPYPRFDTCFSDFQKNMDMDLGPPSILTIRRPLFLPFSFSYSFSTHALGLKMGSCRRDDSPQSSSRRVRLSPPRKKN